jgi:serine/threonine protein kinase
MRQRTTTTTTTTTTTKSNSKSYFFKYQPLLPFSPLSTCTSAPEILQKNPYTEKADVYSYGVMLWEILTRKLPFDSYTFQHQVEDDVIRGIRPDIPEDCPPVYMKLIRDCWDANPRVRPSFHTIVEILVKMIHDDIGEDKYVAMLMVQYNPHGVVGADHRYWRRCVASVSQSSPWLDCSIANDASRRPRMCASLVRCANALRHCRRQSCRLPRSRTRSGAARAMEL